MTFDAGSGYGADEMAIMHAAAEEDAKAPSQKLPPGKWAKKNLFNTWYNSIVTIVFGALTIYILYRVFQFVFVTGRWDPVSTNLELFMIGQFPREERWRIIAQLIILAGGIGFAIGSVRATAKDRAEENGVEYVRASPRELLSSYWAIGLLIIVLLSFTETINPLLITIASIAAFVGGIVVTSHLPKSMRTFGWTLAAVAIVVEFQVLTGTGGWAWFFTTVALAPLTGQIVARLLEDASTTPSWVLVVAGLLVAAWNLAASPDVFGVIVVLIALYAAFLVYRGDRIDGARIAAVMLVGLAVFLIYGAIDLEGTDWSDWGGLQLSLVVATVSILLAFPLGILLALGRRSDLPAVRAMSVIYIEFFRGAPLITFLLSAQFFLGFFLNTDNPLSLITRAVAAITLFSAAYVAEITRGGLQAVDRGQVEAGQAIGLSQPKIMRMIVLPQALRAVIPAMVGQFISLFKDTSLLIIISIPEFLAIRDIVHGQEAFRGFGIGETLVFVAFGFWAISFTMSRESQRLERRLGVGQR